MFQHQYTQSTANTYVSALGYCHRLVGAPDPSKVFWVVEMLKGYKKMGMRIDNRRPITLPILRNLIEVTPSLCSTSLCSTFEGCAVSRKMFSDFLSLVFPSCGLDSSKYKGHSFRIGAATFAVRSTKRYGALKIRRVSHLHSPI